MENYLKISLHENFTAKLMPGNSLLRIFSCIHLIDSSHCIQQILEAVRHCHENNIVHRDLKVRQCPIRSLVFFTIGIFVYFSSLRIFYWPVKRREQLSVSTWRRKKNFKFSSIVSRRFSSAKEKESRKKTE